MEVKDRQSLASEFCRHLYLFSWNQI